MKRSGPPLDDLLNLPLTDAAASPEPAAQRLEAQDLLPFDSAEPEEPIEQEAGTLPGLHVKASLSQRIKAGLFDFVSVAGVVLVAVAGTWALGVTPAIDGVPGLVLFTVSFSFLYTIVPLTFWSQTPGMVLTHLAARAGSNSPLTIQQAIRRWLGAAITVLLCGLPALLMLTGRSAADRLSDTWVKQH